MRCFYAALFVLSSTILATPVFGHHLGPIVLGEKRTEEVAFCRKGDNLDKIIAAEKASIASGGSVEAYLELITPFATADQCRTGMIPYTPTAVLREWLGREGMPDGSTSVVPFVAVKATLEMQDSRERVIEIIVFSSDVPKKPE